MKVKLIFRYLNILFFSCILYTQQYYSQNIDCPEIINIADTDITCKPGCLVTYSASFSVPIKATNTYTITNVAFNPFPTTGTSVLSNQDDKFSGIINIGFCFQFFGTNYTQCLITSNGSICFDLSNANLYNSYIMNSAIPSTATNMDDLRNSILGPFHDIDVTNGGSINYAVYGTAPCRAFVATWYDIPLFGESSYCPGTTNAKQQIVIYETTNIIDIYIWDKDVCPGWPAFSGTPGAAIEGIQNAAGTVAFVVPGRNVPTQWTATNDGKRFSPNGANKTINYEWIENGNPVSNSEVFAICSPTTTSYVAKATVSNNNCTNSVFTKTVTITNTGINPTIDFMSDETGVTIDNFTVLFTNNTSNADSYLWSFGDQAGSTSTLQDPVSFTYPGPGVYTVSLTACNTMGCCTTKTKQVNVAVEPTFFISNAFSPNGDNVNDTWLPQYQGMKSFEVNVFDRWGEKVFGSNDITVGWNGKVNNNGVVVPLGVYVYRLKYIDINNQEVELVGHVTVLR